MTNDKKQQKAEEAASKEFKEKEAIQIEIANPAEALEDSVRALQNNGGFDLFLILDAEMENMDPDTPAVKDVFLSESEWKDTRTDLQRKINAFLQIFSLGESITDMVSNAEEQAIKLRGLFNNNLKLALDKTRPLEEAYWNVALFFKNSGSDNLKSVEIVNISREAIRDLNDNTFFPKVESWIREGYHSFDMTENYSMLVIPGWLGKKQTVDKWGEMAHKYKVMLLTDYRDVDTKSASKLLEKDSLASGAAHLQHVLMFYNNPVIRSKDEQAGEKNDLRASAATAVAGLMYDCDAVPISQARAGTKFGRLKEVSGVAENLLDFEAAALDEKSIIPTIFKANSVYSWGNRTLFNGNNKGLQEYTIVRTFDWIGKVMMNFLTEQCFKRFTPSLEKDLRSQIISFLNDYTGNNKLLQRYHLGEIKQDEKTKDILIDINLTPFFAAKNFIVTITGHEGKQFDADAK
jgi:hypothetical protein